MSFRLANNVYAAGLFLQEARGASKPPVVSARTLSLVADLDGKKPMPPRKTLAKRWRCSVFTVDVAIYGFLRDNMALAHYDKSPLHRTLVLRPWVLDGLKRHGWRRKP